MGNRISAHASLEQLIGFKVDISPLDALLMCVRITAAEVTYFTHRISQLEENQVAMRPTTEVVDNKGNVHALRGKRELNIWIRERQKALLNLGRFSKMALDAGVEERLVRVAETVGNQIATLLRNILEDLDLDKVQQERAPDIVRRHLRLLEGGVAS